MPKSIDELLAEADSIIEKRAEKKEEESSDISEILKLAQSLQNETIEEDDLPESNCVSLLEKVARSLAITEVFANLPTLKKLGEFNKVASERGCSPDQIDAYLEKAASQTKMVKMVDIIPWLSEV